jgi:hypothetical protein
LISEANDYFRKPLLSMALLGLSIAPGPTAKVVSFWRKLRSGASV